MEMNTALGNLLEKYCIKPVKSYYLNKSDDEDALILIPGYFFTDANVKKNQVPLLTWRTRRKFVELKKITEEEVIKDVCLLRFSCMGNEDIWSLFSILYREMDLVEFITNRKIVSVHAVFSDQLAGNVIAKLDNDVICSIEAGIQTAENAPLIERHEIIARRGVACDLSVDTQIPQSSVYCFTKDESKMFTDNDMELFGFNDLQVDHIRSAFQILKTPGLIENWQKQHTHLVTLSKMAIESDKEHKKINL
jgi:hypothetical protein